ncbi:MAG TPA: MG2 domain-containing protein [Bryobacteraceae bacterium]
MTAKLPSFVRVVLALTVAAPLTCQNEAQPYFSLSSNRTFGSHDRPSIMLSGTQIDSVQIRVYRIKDALQFFTQIEDPHSFGGRYPRPTGKRTLLESIHAWKRSLRRQIRLNLRGQFTESPSAHFAQWFPKKPKPVSSAARATYYAAAPLLNPQQLVLSFVQPLGAKVSWKSTEVPIPVREKGVFLVEAVNGALRAYTIVLVSDTALVTKISRSHILAWLANRETGEPIPHAIISSVIRDGQPVRVETDGDGLAQLAMPAKPATGLRVVAANGADLAVSNLGEWSFSSLSRNWTGYVYTDRPVYRPGDTMHFRGILRLQSSTGYDVASAQNFSAEITGPDGNSVYQKTLTTNSNGILHDEFSLPRDAGLGSYYIQIHAGDSIAGGGNFEVQEYKKPEYEVRVTPAKPRVLEGESVSATIDARYYFGEPVNGGKVKYSIYRTRYWFPFWYDADEDSSESEGGNAFDDESGEQIAQEEGSLDSDGRLIVTIPTTVSDNKIDYRYRIEAGVTDAAGREIAGTGWLIATYGSFVVNVTPTNYFFAPSTTARFRLETRDYDNRPLSSAAHLELASYNFRDRSAGRVVSRADVTTGADGTATAELQLPAQGGSYRVRVNAPSANGRSVEDSTFIWVSGAGNNWYSGEQRTVQIIPDKKSYRAGETAKILLVTGKANTPIWVTVEGRDLRTAKLLRSSGATAEFDYTVSADDQPGFFISAQFLRGGEIYQGEKRIKVPPEDHKLNVTLKTDKPQYLPGETATYAIDATTTTGQPAANADLSLGVVDEAIYAIRPDYTPNILDYFYGRNYNSVYTDNSLTYYFNGEAGTRRMRLAALRRPSQLAQLKPERLVRPKVRKAFPDTAFWAADITTDRAGHANVKVSLPDSLTTWRATARGVTPDARYGGAVLKTIVRKNLIVRLAVPRFFVQCDEVVISGLVHNYLPTAKKARVSVHVEGLDVTSGGTMQEVEIASRAEAKVDWRVKAQLVRHAKVTAEALTDEESDALEMDLPVNPPGVPVRQSKGGTLTNTASTALDFTFPSDAVPGSRSLSIRLLTSIAGSIFNALDFLTSFPYGCVEQTMSSFLPDLMVNKAMRELNLKEPVDQNSLKEKIQAGLDRLYTFQHEDGGWGWWQSDESHPFMTAYVAAGLAEARADGVAVKTEAVDRGAAWIKKALDQEKNLAPDLRAYLAYALAIAGRVDRTAVDRSYAERTSLSPYGTAILGLAFDTIKDPRAAELARRLVATVRENGEEASWPAERDEMLDFSADITPEATAYALKLLTRQQPDSSLLPKAALWLVNHRNQGYWWSSTKQTAMVIYGLIDYLKATNELHPDLSATVTVNGRATATLASPEIVLDESKLQSGLNQIQIAANGRGRLYYSVAATHYSNQARMEKQASVSLNILRDYYRLVPSNTDGRIVYNLVPLDGAVSQGDVLAVRLTVTGSDWNYLMMEDPIPAGAEFIEKDNLYEIRNRPPWWRYWFTRRELHDDRMAIFQTHFANEQQQYFYLLKVVNPGLFHVSPARVQPMYQPGYQATTEARTLEVR